MELTLLAIPGCPGAAEFEEMLAGVLADRSDVVLHRREISGELAAAEAGMHGSPTLLINGADPFAVPASEPGLFCRLYPRAAGRPGRVPSAEALRQALAGVRD